MRITATYSGAPGLETRIVVRSSRSISSNRSNRFELLRRAEGLERFERPSKSCRGGLFLRQHLGVYDVGRFARGEGHNMIDDEAVILLVSLSCYIAEMRRASRVSHL